MVGFGVGSMVFIGFSQNSKISTTLCVTVVGSAGGGCNFGERHAKYDTVFYTSKYNICQCLFRIWRILHSSFIFLLFFVVCLYVCALLFLYFSSYTRRLSDHSWWDSWMCPSTGTSVVVNVHSVLALHTIYIYKYV